MQEITPTLILGRRQHRRPFQANLGSRSMFVTRFRLRVAGVQKLSEVGDMLYDQFSNSVLKRLV
jgi:hypothetical protein